MSNILVIGTGPLFAPDIKVFNGQALRTWHFTKALVDAGHQVDLVVLPAEGSPLPESPTAPYVPAANGSFTYQLFTTNVSQEVMPALQAIHDAKPYDCIVAVNSNAADLACRLPSQLPFWVDLHGHIMGEAQTKCKVYDTDSYLKHFWEKERVSLRRADRISTVSFKQMYATLGELGAIGRLNRFNFSHPFVSVSPIAVYEEFLNPVSYPKQAKYRGSIFPDDAVALLWTGGYNTWMDIRTLAAALSLAMELDSRIRFVSTGGSIPGHDEISYGKFVSQMQQTGFADRCHFLGWIEARELFPLFRECDLGINIDSLNYETMFGARNRLTNMMGAGLAVVTTLGTEISEIIEEKKLGYVVPIADVQALADTLVHAAQKPSQRKSYAHRAQLYAADNFNYASTTQAMLKWATHPTLAPDNEAKIRRCPEEKYLPHIALNSLEEEVMYTQQHSPEELLRYKDELDGLRQKPLYRIYKTFFS